jgi:ribonuclease T2
MKRIAVSLSAFALALLMLLVPAHAQRGGGTPGEFDFYVLALSWSSGFCTVEGDAKGIDQCAIGRGNSFVLHGLWPQYERGFPSDCAAERNPSRIAMDAAKGVYDSEGLARYEWRKHGTCSGLDPRAYFLAARQAVAKIVIPEEFRRVQSERQIAPIEIERAFSAANAGLRPDTMAVACKKGVLQEVRICLSRDLRDFRPCPEVNRDSCRAQKISVPPIR